MNKFQTLISNGIAVEKAIKELGDEELYQEILEDFYNELDEKICTLESYKNDQDTENYAIYAHSLKSNAKYLGMTKLAEISLNHELEGKNNNLDYITNNFIFYKDELLKIKALLEEYFN